MRAIDWRDEFGRLEPFGNTRGGVVRIRFAGPRSAPASFLDTLKSVQESKGGRSIRIDRPVYSVRYLSGIRDEFIRLLGVKLSTAKPAVAGAASLNVQRDIDAGGNVSAHASNIRQNVYFGDNPELMTSSRNVWLRELCDQVAGFLQNSSFTIIINHGDPEEQDEFWRFMWRNALERLIPDGLVLIHMVDSSSPSEIHEFAPPANVEFELPAALSIQAQAHATEDIAAILMAEFPSMSREIAIAKSHAIVSTHADNVGRLHAKHAAYLLTLAESARPA